MLLYKFIYYGTLFEYYGGFGSASGSYPPPQGTYDPFTENGEYYYEAYGHKIYNSAILSYGGDTRSIAVFPSQCYVWECVGSSFSRAINYNVNDGHGAFTTGVIRETVGGVEIVRNDLWQGFTPTGSDLPIFTDPQEFMDYITNPVVLHTWTTVPSISGNQMSMALSQVKDAYLGDGSAETFVAPTGIERLTNASNLYNILENVGESPVPIAYCGDNYIYAQAVYNNDIFQYYELGFVIAGGLTPIYTYQIVAESIRRTTWLQIVVDEEAQVARLCTIGEISTGYKIFREVFTSTQEEFFYTWLQGNSGGSGEDPYDDGSDDGGGENFGLTPEDPLPLPDMPSVSGLGTGLFTVYNPDDTEMQHLADFLWDPTAAEALMQFFQSPQEAIIACYMLPVGPDNYDTKQLKLGNLDVTNCGNVKYLKDGATGSGRYKEINFGSFSLKPKFDSYLDFNPYTTLKIYLPYIGVQNLNVDEFMCPAQSSGAIGKTGYNNSFTLKYRIDLITGVVSAFILRNGNVRYQFTGKCGMTMPITGANYDNAVQGVVTCISALAATVATGGAAAPIGASAAVAGTIAAQKERVYHSGNLGGEASIFAYDTPYLIITRPNISEDTSDSKKFLGLPSYKSKDTLGSYSGFTKVFDAHVDNLSCTDEEKEEILTLLRGGVII